MAPQTATEPLLNVTEVARTRILDLRAAEDDPEGLALRVEVVGVRAGDFAYDLAFEPVAEADDGDLLFDAGGLPVLVPGESADQLRGATLDLPSAPGQDGLVLRNPNRPVTPRLGEAIELTGTVEERIRQLLDQQVNPAIAAHGGYAGLVRVEDSTAFITMGGGCQGCAMSALTLREGIQSAILANIAEITSVEDVTDHAQGENPFYS